MEDFHFRSASDMPQCPLNVRGSRRPEGVSRERESKPGSIFILDQSAPLSRFSTPGESKLSNKDWNLLKLRMHAKQEEESRLPRGLPTRLPSGAARQNYQCTDPKHQWYRAKAKRCHAANERCDPEAPRMRFPLLSGSHIGSELVWNRAEISAYAWPARSARLQYWPKRVIFKS